LADQKQTAQVVIGHLALCRLVGPNSRSFFGEPSAPTPFNTATKPRARVNQATNRSVENSPHAGSGQFIANLDVIKQSSKCVQAFFGRSPIK